MTAQIIQFIPRPNPKREAELMLQAYWDFWRQIFELPVKPENKEPA